MQISEDDIRRSYTATVISSTRLTPPGAIEVRELELRLPPGELTFREGQCVAVLLQGPHEFGNLYHVRLYSVAAAREDAGGKAASISICVRRCWYTDPVSGEQFPGKASHYLCDAVAGDEILAAGPYGAYFPVPADPSSNIVMVGTGTGIAPFRSFVRRIHQENGGWRGKVRVYFGAESGLELLYENNAQADFGLYYDEATFRAFDSIRPRTPVLCRPAAGPDAAGHAREVWGMIQEPKTYVYIAGHLDAEQRFERAMAGLAGSERAWSHRRWVLMTQHRYAQMLHE